MTGLDEQAAALRRLVGRLDDTAAALAGIREAVTGCWDDAAGREWDGRLDLVRRAADRLAGDVATEAAELERRAAEEADTARAGDDPGDHGGGGGPEQAGGSTQPGHGAAGGTGVGATSNRAPDAASGVPGLRVPGYTGIRVSDRRGLVAPLLPPMDGAQRGDHESGTGSTA